MIKGKIRDRSGESLVEIMAGAFLFLMMMALLQGAVTFCSNAQRRSEQVRDRNARICRSVRDTAYTGGAEQVYAFRATDGAGSGSGVLFRVEAQLGKKEVPYTDETGAAQSMTFYLFGSTVPAGGGDP